VEISRDDGALERVVESALDDVHAVGPRVAAEIERRRADG
jgi:hypothetical protein